MKTIQDKKILTIEVMKSKFIGIAFPLKNVEDFKPLLSEIKKEYSKAKHIVYAYRIGMNSKSNDDGEPKGTAGRPLLELLYKKNMTDVVIFVVRYFGGTKLGASRLLRTYVQAGNNVLSNAQIIEY